MLRAAAAVLGSPALRLAADAYDRAARAPWGRLPPPTPAGSQLRAAARLVAAAAHVTRDRPLAHLAFLIRMIALIEAVAELRPAQQRPAQAAAAPAAARQLRAATAGHRPGAGPDRGPAAPGWRPRTSPPGRHQAPAPAGPRPGPPQPGRRGRPPRPAAGTQPVAGTGVQFPSPFSAWLAPGRAGGTGWRGCGKAWRNERPPSSRDPSAGSAACTGRSSSSGWTRTHIASRPVPGPG